MKNDDDMEVGLFDNGMDGDTQTHEFVLQTIQGGP
jgi:hypothetical protein